MHTIVQDLRYGVRQLLKNLGFTAVAVITLALGIGMNATMFSMVSAILLRRPPGHDPDHVAVVTGISPNPGFQSDNMQVSVPNYLAWRDANRVFSEMAASDDFRSASLTSQRDSEAVRAAAVSANYFDVLGASAQMGRTFVTGEDQLGQDHEVILSHQLWERRFGADRSIIGRTIRLNRENYTVVGVMPASFRMLGFLEELWTPLVVRPADQTAAARRDRPLYIYGRMKPGVTIEQARAEFATFARQAAVTFPDPEKGWGATARTFPDFLVYGFGIRSGLAVIMTTVAFVLLIACANVSGLLLARAAARRKELAIRLSLGAGRLRIIRQLLTEGMIIAVLGGGMGLLLAYRGIDFMRVSMSFNDAFNAIGLGLDANVVVFATVVSVACALLCALAPAFRASRVDVTTNLKDESRTASPGRSQSRLRKIMVTGEVALALFLLVGTGLLGLTMFRMKRQNLGFEPQHLLTAGVTLDEVHYKEKIQQLAFVRDVLTRLRQIPGAQDAAVTSDLPSAGPGNVSFRIQGQPDVSVNQARTAVDFLVTPDFFRTAGMVVLRGRQLSEADDANAPRVVLVNQKFVDRYFSGEDPIGKQILLDVKGSPEEWSQIIGIVNNVKSFPENATDDPAVYEAFAQRPLPSFSLMVRATGDPNGLTTALRDKVAEVDSELPLARLMSMPAVLEIYRGGDSFFTAALTAFAFLALILAAIGIYGLIAYSVGQRTHEIGIRMAMGAKSRDVLRLMLREGMMMTSIGALIGFAMALPLPKVFAAIFYDLHVSEPRIYVLVPLLILLVAALATYIPARRAARVDPMNALRQD